MTLRRTLAGIGLACVALGAAGVPAEAKRTVVATGLDNPRGLALSPEGTLYVAEAGRGGPTCIQGNCFGFSGALSRVEGGKVTTVASGLLSFAGKDGSFAAGVDDVAVGPDGSVFGIVTSAAPKQARSLPLRARAQLARVARASGGKAVFDGPRVDSIEFKANPDKTDVNSNPYGLAVSPDGTQYVADAGGNTILQIAGGKASLVAVVPKTGKKAQPVPTVVRIGPDGALYVGVLGGDGTPADGAKVFRIVPGRPATVYAKGLRNITGLAFDKDGSLYVTELYRTGSEKAGPNADGDVVKIAADGIKTRIGSVPFPAGVVVADDGTVYVSAFSVVPGSTARKGPFKGAAGQIVKFSQ